MESIELTKQWNLLMTWFRVDWSMIQLVRNGLFVSEMSKELADINDEAQQWSGFCWVREMTLDKEIKISVFLITNTMTVRV